MTAYKDLGKSELAARQAYERDLCLGISCIAEVRLLTKWSESYKRWLLVVSPRQNRDISRSGSLDDETGFIMLRRKDGTKLYLELDQHVEVVKASVEKGDRYRVSTVRYIYAIWESPDDCLIGWHYHPDLGVTFPHVHVYDKKTDEEKQMGRKPSLLHKLHIPSGRVSLEDVIHFAITELGVVPNKKRENDWQQVLKETSARFEASKSWGQKPPDRD